jgi:hypothetical protein
MSMHSVNVMGGKKQGSESRRKQIGADVTIIQNTAPVQTFFHDKMDPHSNFSQFNHRVTKAGPQSRNIESIPPPKDPFKMPSRKPSVSTNAVIRRPVATNSRVKQDEIFKRDMYLSFVSNALQQKTNVRLFSRYSATARDSSERSIGLIRQLRRARRTIQQILFKANFLYL